MRISDKSLHYYPFLLQPFFWNQKRKYGAPLKSALLWARIPMLFTAVAMLYSILDRKKSPLDPVLRSLITVRVSQINCCRFCVDINSAKLAARANSMDKVEQLNRWTESKIFNKREKVAIEYAEAMSYSNRHVTDELMGKLKILFNDDSIIEMTGLIAFQNMSSKFNSALDVPSQGFCKIQNRPPEHNKH